MGAFGYSKKQHITCPCRRYIDSGTEERSALDRIIARYLSMGILGTCVRIFYRCTLESAIGLERPRRTANDREVRNGRILR